MAGISLEGVYGRIPCPHCGSNDCACWNGEALYCGATGREFTERELERQAQRLKLTRYRVIRVGDWIMRCFTFVGRDFAQSFSAGRVELWNERHGVRGVCPDEKTARSFIARNVNNLSACYQEARQLA